MCAFRYGGMSLADGFMSLVAPFVPPSSPLCRSPCRSPMRIVSGRSGRAAQSGPA